MANPNVTIEVLLNSDQLKYKIPELTAKFEKIGAGKGLFSGLGGKMVVLNQALELFTKITRGAMRAAEAVGRFGMAVSSAADIVSKAQWKFDIVFEKTNAKAQAAADQIGAYFGRHVSNIQKSMAGVADVLKPAGASEELALGLSKNLAILGQAAEEWTQGRYDAKTATEAFMKALVGEREMLKEMGIVIREQDVKDYINNLGMANTELNKMIATYNLILQRSEDLRESVGTRLEEFGARLTKIKEAFFGLQAAIGEFIEPLVTEFLYFGSVVLEKLTDAFDTTQANEWKSAIEAIAEQMREVTKLLDKMEFEEIAEGWTKLKSIFVEIFNDAVSIAMQHMVIIAAKIGEAIANGIMDGMTKKVTSSSSGSGIPDWAKIGPYGMVADWAMSVGMGAGGHKTTPTGATDDSQMTEILNDYGALLEKMTTMLEDAFPDVSGRPDPDAGADWSAVDLIFSIPWDDMLKKAEKAHKQYTTEQERAARELETINDRLASVRERIKEMESKPAQLGTSGFKEMYSTMLTNLGREDPVQKELQKLREQEQTLEDQANTKRDMNNQLLTDIKNITLAGKGIALFAK